MNLILLEREKYIFISLLNEAIDYEIKIKRLINEWNVDKSMCSIELKAILDYLDSNGTSHLQSRVLFL